jgi:hypothetical protein
MMAMDSIKARLDEYERIIKAQMIKIEELTAENERLRSAAGAHDVLKEIYADANQSTGHRIKAAQAALNVEKPRLEPVPPPMDLVAEEYEPLAVLVERQRRRADAMLAEARDIEVSPAGVVRILPRPGGNGSAGSDD